MRLLVIILFINYYSVVYSETFVYTTTAKNYALDIPKPSAYYDKRSTSQKFLNLDDLSSTEEYNYSSDEVYTHKALKDFLETYSQKIKKKKQEEQLKSSTESDSSKEKPKSWNLLNVQTNSNPFEEKKGWVSLDPIPWSMSKISKWKSNLKAPENLFPKEHNRPDESWNKHTSSQYNFNSDSYHNNKKYRPQDISEDRYDMIYNNDRTDFPKPSYQHKVYVDDFPLRKPGTRHSYKDKDCDSSHQEYFHGSPDIITDNSPSNFPSNPHDSFRRRGTEIEMHPDTHPSNGNGEWVLLSTTKGYKPQKNRQRSLENHPDLPRIAHHTSRMVKLTVLPPLKESKINMTTSHGGLLQVESTFETVEQAKKKFDKKQKIKKKQIDEQIRPTVATVARSQTNDPGAVMAAVGAGMIPATLAMMVPMVMSGKRRRKRNVESREEWEKYVMPNKTF